MNRVRTAPEKLLIICPNWVGDMVMATPALKAMRQCYPHSSISLLVRPYIRLVIEDLPYYDRIIEFDAKGKERGLRGILSCSLRLQKERFDWALILPNSFSSALLSFLSLIPRRIGYKRNMRSWMLTDRIPPAKNGIHIIPVPKVERYLTMCSYLGCKPTSQKYELAISQHVESKVDDLFQEYNLNQSTITIVIIPGAAYGSSKCWKAGYFAQVADQLIEKYQCHVIIVPGPDEVTIARDIEKSMKHQPITLTKEIVPLDILKGIIKRSSMVITNDTGPRHFATAFEKPVVVIMGPTNPIYTQANLERTIVLREELDCSPCHLRECPTNHKCMELITPQKVLNACDELIEKFLN
ncbi:MAG: hypothetical protein AMJ42_03385 [Deltaproteobacteria bacterium DG_8]|nr:MAG: hypothetical protein AMJ42_03385 [Deltaproteobacteria bacterium DG_8]